MKKHEVKVNHMDMVYEECGESNGWTVVLLHGFCGTSRYWHKVCPLLNDKYRIIMPQLRGHGGTSAPDDIYSMEAMADDIYSLLKALNIEKVVMFGHSLGGYVTLAFADKYPDMLLGMGLIHSTALPDTVDKKKKRLQDIYHIAQHGIEDYVSRFIPKLFSVSKLSELDAEITEIINIGLEMNPKGAMLTLEGMMQRPDRSHVLTKAAFPILLVAGSQDDIISPLETFSITNKNIADSTFGYPHILENTFENVAHMSLVEAPNQLSRIIANYMKILYEKEELRLV